MTIPLRQNGVILSDLPEKFQDTTGSGTGNLRGVTQRLTIYSDRRDAIWLTPFYISPQVMNAAMTSQIIRLSTRPTARWMI